MLSVRISSYGCTREVWRARKQRKSCSRVSHQGKLSTPEEELHNCLGFAELSKSKKKNLNRIITYLELNHDEVEMRYV